LTVTEAAHRLGVSVRTVHRRVASGDIPTTKDSQGRTRIPVEAVRPAERSPEALVISDTMSHVLDRYGATLARLERSRNRWSVVAVAGVAVGVTGATLAAVMSLTAGNLNDRLADTTNASGDLSAGLTASTGILVRPCPSLVVGMSPDATRRWTVLTETPRR